LHPRIELVSVLGVVTIVVVPVPVAAAIEITGILVMFDTMMVEGAVAPLWGNEAEPPRLTGPAEPLARASAHRTGFLSKCDRQCHQQAGGDGDGANDAPGGFFVT
jgi:hypothetical protein